MGDQMDNIVLSLEHIARQDSNLNEDRAYILSSLASDVRDTVEKLSFEEIEQKFTTWLINLIQKERPPKEIQGFNFGLFESGENCRLYVSGTLFCDPDNPDWPCNTDWWPEGRYAPEMLLSDIWEKLNGFGDDQWVVTQAIIIALVKSFYRNNGLIFQEVTGISHACFASGFDEGDLYLISTSISPL